MSQVGGIATTMGSVHKSTDNPDHTGAHTPPSKKIETEQSPLAGVDVLEPDALRPLEKFLPVTRFALMDRLCTEAAWPPGEAKKVRRFFRYLDYWRHQRYAAKLIDLERIYEPFSPDSDLLMTRKFTDSELATMQTQIVSDIREILQQANYEQIDPKVVEDIMSADTHYGLDLQVDFSLFEECLIFYRGASKKREQRRTIRKFFFKENFDVPIFQRLCLLFKVKPLEVRIREIIAEEKVSHKEAEKIAKKQRAHIPAEVSSANIYLKLFKNIPRSDVEMIFPNTVVKFRMLDKLRLGIFGAGGVGMGIFGALSKFSLLFINPIAAAGAIFGLGAVIVRQFMSFFNQKQRYMVIMAQNLYFHSLADNRGVMTTLVDRAADEDVKEEILLYSVLAKERVRRSDLNAVDEAIEQYIKATFDKKVDFDLDDALQRLEADGIVTDGPDGYLQTMPPEQASTHIDNMWDLLLDELPDIESQEGYEFEGQTSQPQAQI